MAICALLSDFWRKCRACFSRSDFFGMNLIFIIFPTESNIQGDKVECVSLGTFSVNLLINVL